MIFFLSLSSFSQFLVDADEIRRLGKRFRKLDLDNSGALSVDEFMSITELQQNPLVQRVIDIFDADGNGEVDFKEFIQGVSQFSVKGDKLSKLRFAFRIYDMDNDGYISNGELFQVSEVSFCHEAFISLKMQHNKMRSIYLVFWFFSISPIASNSICRLALQVLKMMVGNNLKDTQLQQIVDKTIVFADKDEDGKISFDEFCSVVGNTDIHKKMVVDV